MAKKKSNVRAYLMQNGINETEKLKLVEVLLAYRKLATNLHSLIWNEFYKTGNIASYNPFYGDVDTTLSARYEQTCFKQVAGMVKSFVSNRQNDFVTTVVRSSLSKETQHKMLAINKSNNWFKSEGYEHKSKDDSVLIITKEDLKLARKIFRHVINRCRLPNCKNINLALDTKVAVIEENQTTKKWDFWVKVSSLESGNKIKIPVKSNGYFSNGRGEQNNFVQINFIDDEIRVYFVKTAEMLPYDARCKSIGLDFGLATFLASSRGDKFGQRVLDKLLKVDTELIKIVKRHPTTYMKIKRYKDLVQYLRGYLKSLIGSSLNRVIEIYAPSEIVVEKLDFRDSNLSRQMNRILRNCGLGALDDKLDRLNLDYGIAITKVNAAYTSKMCSNCGYISPNNRQGQANFKCKCCGYKNNADVNGALNIDARRSSKTINVALGTKKVLHILLNEFISKIETKFKYKVKGVKGYSYACPYNLQDIFDNEYFMNYCSREELNTFCSKFRLVAKRD